MFLQSSEGTKIEVDQKTASRSILVKNMFENLKLGEMDTQLTIPLPNVKAQTLNLVVQYLTHHKEDEELFENDEDENSEYDVEGKDKKIVPWDQEFIKVDQPTLYDITLAANYMNIKPLLDLCCLTIANMIKGKSPDEIRKCFNIENDFTPEEEEQIRKENAWMDEA